MTEKPTYDQLMDKFKKLQLENIKLKESEKFSSKIFKSMPGIIYVYDIEENRNIYSNDGIEKILGYSLDEIKAFGNRLFDILLHPEDIENVYNIQKKIINLRDDKSLLLEYRMKNKKGEWIWLKSIEMPFLRNSSGKVKQKIGIAIDITEKKNIELKIKDSEEKYKALFEGINDAAFVHYFKEEGFSNFIEVNQIACDRYGYTREEFLEISPKNISDLTDANLKGSKNHRKKLLKNKWSVFTATHITKNGKKIPVEISSRIFKLGDKNVIFSLARDITERKKQFEKLKESEAKYRDFFKNSPKPYQSLDKNGNILDVNPMWLNKLGYKKNEVIGKWFGDFLDDLSKDSFKVNFKKFKKNGQISNAEFKMKKKNGEYLDVMFEGRIFYDKLGKVVHTRCVFDDITEQKKYENQILDLNSLLESIRNINELIIEDVDEYQLLNKTCEILQNNRNYQNIELSLFYEDIKQLTPVVNKGIHSLRKWSVTLDGKGSAPNCIKKCLKEKKSFFVKDFEKFCKDCDYFDEDNKHNSIFVPIMYKDKLYGFFAIAIFYEHEISKKELNLLEEISGDLAFALEKKSLEKSQIEIKKQLIQSQKMESIGRLAGGVAHDYNNMLSVIFLYCELTLKKIKKDDPIYKNINEIYNAAKKSADITKQLLIFARKQSIEPEIINLNEHLETLLKMIRKLIGENIELNYEPGIVDCFFKFDKSQIDQIITNLCINARDAIENVGNITIQTDEVYFNKEFCEQNIKYKEGNFILLSVKDSGSGISEENLKQIFEPFFTTKEVGKGTGLGLSTVYGIVYQNNGFINVESEICKGTKFEIYLPYNKEDIEQKKTNGNTLFTKEGNGETILIVEDDDSIMALLKSIFENLNYNVLAETDPEKALKLGKENSDLISLLISDVIMPKLNGRDLSEKLKQLIPNLKIIFISGYTDDILSPLGILENNVKFVQKPFNTSKLANMVRNVLDEN